ncbi:dynactin-associated protein [Rattus rattus]|uniref:dynactin-associated protein n=1 Tax=Rattus rattus TaxID=10117 RepID=UPI0013F2E5EA|nr:dynactin-associated protein [Rattus rattus]
MGRKQQQYNMNVEQNVPPQLLRNPYCSTEGTQCGCRSHHVTCELHQVTKNSCSLWKIFLICLLACLVATAITALAFYFGHFGSSTNTTIVVHTDGRSCQDPCVSPSTPSPTTTPSPGPGASPSPDTTAPSLSSTPPTSTTVMPITTTEHDVEIDYE